MLYWKQNETESAWDYFSFSPGMKLGGAGEILLTSIKTGKLLFGFPFCLK